jgi:hypothetical protein
MSGINYITLQEVADKLKHSSGFAQSWCVKNNIRLYKIGSRYVVNEIEFRCAYEKPVIDDLKEKYKDEWEKHYRILNNDDIPGYVKLMDQKKFETIKINKVFIADDFLKELRNEKAHNSKKK